MSRFGARAVAAQLLAVLGIVAMSGVAAAITGGEYTHDEMDCSATADAHNRTDAEHGCHSVKINVTGGSVRYAEFGVDQTAVGDSPPHGFCASANTGGTGGGHGNDCGNGAGNQRGEGVHTKGDLRDKDTKTVLQLGAPHRTGTIDNLSAHGFDFYFAADDNLSGGEHDGVDGRPETGTDGVADGPSDGGAITLFVHPQDATTTPSASNPSPVAGAALGSCADGICEDVSTHRHTIYRGGQDESRNAADYEGKEWDPFDCTGADPEGQASCDSGKPGGAKNLNDWKAREGEVHADPGVQIYEDPDAQGSPLDPIAELKSGLGMDDGTTPLYPLPGFYVGTCGLIVQGERQGPDTCA